MTTTINAPLQTLQTGHVGLNVSDLDRSKRFYQELFGFEVMRESREEGCAFVFLSDGERLVLTLWQQSEGRFRKDAPGLHHLSFQVETIDAVREAEARLRALGVSPLHGGIVPHSEGAVSGGIFFEDPDGIRLEIFSPAGADDRPAPTGSAPTCGFF